MIGKRFIHPLTCITLAGMVLAACSSQGTSNNSSGATPAKQSNQPTEKKKENVTLELWWPLTSGDKRNEVFYQALEEYQKLNPNVKINAQSIPYDRMQNKIVTSANSGYAPDITYALNEWVVEFNKMGILADLTADVNSIPDKDKIPQAVWNAVQVDGKVVAMPNYVGIRALVYHKNMLEKAGVSAPPKTWDELIEVGKKIKAQGMIPYGLVGKSARLPQELIVYFWQNDTDIALKMPDGKYRNTWAEDPVELKKATGVYEFYKKMLDEGVISKDEVNWGYTEMDTNLAQGRFAMGMNGPWMQNYEQEHPETMKDVEISPPVYSKKQATFLEVIPLLTYKNSKNHDEAVKFLKWWVSKDAQAKMYPNRSVRSDVVDPSKWGQGFSSLVNYGRSWPGISMGIITQSMIDSVQMVLMNKKTPEEAAKWLSGEVNKSLEQNGELSKK